MRQTDDRPAAGAAAAATGSAAVDAALDLVEQGLGRLAAVDASSLPEGCVTDTVRRLSTLDGRVDGIQARFVAAACRGPDCDLPPHRCIVHHITWWDTGGPTSTTNGALLCGHHHDLIHDHGWTLTMDPPTRRCTWTPPHKTTTTVTQPWGPAARGQALPQPATSPTPGAHAGQSDSQPNARSGEDCTITATSRPAGPQRPLGRSDPGRPRNPGSDPPSSDRSDRGPTAARHDPEPLQLNL